MLHIIIFLDKRNSFKFEQIAKRFLNAKVMLFGKFADTGNRKANLFSVRSFLSHPPTKQTSFYPNIIIMNFRFFVIRSGNSFGEVQSPKSNGLKKIGSRNCRFVSKIIYPIMLPAMSDVDTAIFHMVNQTVFIIDSAAVFSLQVTGKRFGFSNSLHAAITPQYPLQLVDSFDCLFILYLPVKIIFPSII